MTSPYEEKLQKIDEDNKGKKKDVYTVEPGRCIYRNGRPFVGIKRDGDQPNISVFNVSPYEADRFTHRVVALLNKYGFVCPSPLDEET